MKELPVTKEILRQLYAETPSAISLSKQLGVGKNRLFYWLKVWNLTNKGNYEALIHTKLGKLTIESVVFKKNGNRQVPWLECSCECGTKRLFRATIVKNGYARSCGCSLKKLEHHCGIRGDFFKHIERSGKTRGHAFHLTIQQIWELFLKQGKRCALSGELLVLCHKRTDITASLDRIDSTKDYTLDNVQWVHKDVNYMKRTLPEHIFLSWVAKIHNHKN